MTLVFGFAAVNTGNNLLFLIVASQLGFMAVSGIIGWLNIRRLQARISFPDEIYSGTDTLVTVHVEKSRSFLPSFLVTVHLLDHSVVFPLVEDRHAPSMPLAIRFSGRGRKRIEECWISSTFPVNFFVRFRPSPPSEEVVVFPRPSAVPVADDGGTGKEGGGETIMRGYEGDVAKIGDYTGTEPQKLIHWKLSARHEQFKVKEMTALLAEPVIIDLAAVRGGTVEERLSGAAFLVNRLVRQNRPVGLKIGDRVVEPAATRGHRLLLLRELALYGEN